MAAARPRRLQRSRIRPLPAGAVCVTRPGRWGNPYRVEEHGQSEAVALFREHVLGDAALLTAVRRELRGRDLACWCKPGEPCHADVLLELANPKPEPQGDQLGLFELGAAQLLQLEQAAAALALGDQQQAQGPPGRGS